MYSAILTTWWWHPLPSFPWSSLFTVLQDASNRVGLGLLTDAVVFSCVSDFLSPDAETESDIRGGPLQDIWQHSDHTHPARRYMHLYIVHNYSEQHLMVLMYMYVPFECALITTDPLPLCRPSSEVPRDEIGWRVHWSRWEHVTAVGEQLVIWALVCTTYSVYHCTGSYIALHFVEHSVHQVYDIPNTPL